MLDNAMNHASILTWGWFNEGPSNGNKLPPSPSLPFVHRKIL